MESKRVHSEAKQFGVEWRSIGVVCMSPMHRPLSLRPNQSLGSRAAMNWGGMDIADA